MERTWEDVCAEYRSWDRAAMTSVVPWPEARDAAAAAVDAVRAWARGQLDDRQLLDRLAALRAALAAA